MTTTVVYQIIILYLGVLIITINAAIQKFYLGVNESNPAVSCAEVFTKKLNVPSGYYWLQSTNGSAVRARAL